MRATGQGCRAGIRPQEYLLQKPQSSPPLGGVSVMLLRCILERSKWGRGGNGWGKR